MSLWGLDLEPVRHANPRTNVDRENFKLDASMTGFIYRGTKYFVHDCVYLSPYYFSEERETENFKGGRNVGLKAYVVCQLLDICEIKQPNRVDPNSVQVKVRRFFRPEDISLDKAYSSDIRELPSHRKLRYSYEKPNGDAMSRKKGKCKEGEIESEIGKSKKASQDNHLTTLDIFSGCGGLSEGLHQSGVSVTKWAIEYEEAAAEAFKLNHPGAKVFINNCNVILRAIMQKCGDADDCISTHEAAELASKLDQDEIDNLPLPGQIDFINGGPPCQGFSGMNRFNQSTWSKVQCEMILTFLSFADYYRPKFFLLENVRNFVSFNQGQTFRLTLASLLEMGYQVRFGVLEAGAFGVPQSRKRAFIWAASPDEVLPEWPEPMHVFATPELKSSLAGNSQYSAVRSTTKGAPFRSLTVRDTICDLPPVSNGASKTSVEVKLSNGQTVDLIPWCLPNTAKRHNQWKGLFGRLDWDGNFPTSITDPQPMGKLGMCFHPEQDRIMTVRECACSQGFPDSYKFYGTVIHKHRQIGNAVPPPLAYALGTKLKQALQSKTHSTHLC